MDCDCVQQPDDAYQSKLAYWETQPVVVLFHRISEWVTVGVSEPKRSCAMQRDNDRHNFAAINIEAEHLCRLCNAVSALCG